jgi:class 3 adenylate cyclase/tetratricopeptide (TPR) repeat protein
MEAGQKFCGECGTPAAASAGATTTAPATRPATAQVTTPVSERRLVSVLFADLVGFTPFSEERDAEDVRETLTRYFDIARDVIQRHGGTVEKFIGDAVMAVWGTPTAREDDAERAVRTALELLDAIRGLGPGIQARAGVLTGEAAVTLGATDQGMVAGDLVNTAARLQSVAPPNTVLVGESTYRAASAAIAFEPAGEQLLKGKQAPVPAWRALRVVAERGGRGRADAIEAPFTGRDAELRLLKELFHTTGRESRARLVSVTGPAGIGKSRLARELEKYLDGVVETVWWHHGRSPAYSGGLTFWALGEMIRARCGLAETDGEAETRAKVAATLAEHLPDADERAWVEPALLQLLGVDVPPVSATELFARWRVLFERLAADATVVLVFEDLHWADPGTLEFIDHVLDWSKSSPILILTLSRPELLDARPDWGAGRRNFVAVALDPLSGADMRTMLGALVPGLPQAAVQRIVERAEGIPLYAVETVRMLVAEGRLAERGDAYEVVGEISALAVPETLTALIAARLDTLDPADRALVMDAAVLGQRFTVDGLAAISGVDGAALEPRLRGLVRRELLTLEADPRSPERGQYGFVQALIREVAYNTLARRDRKERHLAAARFFEQLGNDELAGALAGHYLSAHANAQEGPEADALAAQARVALRGAAERASSLASNEQAVALLRQALTVAPGDADRADLLERLGLAQLAAGHTNDGLATLVEARELHVAGNDPAGVVRATLGLIEGYVQGAQGAPAVGLTEETLAGYADVPDLALILRLRSQLARALLVANDWHRAIVAADEVLEPAERGAHLAIVADTLVTKGSSLANLGRMLEAGAILELADRIAEAEGLTHPRLRSAYNRMVHFGLDPDRAFAGGRDGLALARKIGNIGWANAFAAITATVALFVGDWDATERETRTLRDADLTGGELGDALATTIMLHAFRGEDVSADVASIQRLLEADPGSAINQINTMVARAATAFADGRDADAFLEYRELPVALLKAFPYEALSVASMALLVREVDAARHWIGIFDDVAAVRTLFGYERDGLRAAAAFIDGDDQGLDGLVAASRRLAEASLPMHAARLAIVAGTLAPDDPRARALLREARGFYERVGARALIARCDRLLAAAESETAAAG